MSSHRSLLASGALHASCALLPALESGATREFVLYLPLYNGVEFVKVGVDPDASLLPSPIQSPRPPPVVFCTCIPASRPLVSCAEA